MTRRLARLQELCDRLHAAFCGRIALDEPLAPRTSYRIGGPADLAVFPRNPDELAAAVRALASCGGSAPVLGGGSNVLVSDHGVRGVVIVTTEMDAITVAGNQLVAQAGAPSDQVAAVACAFALTGAEFLTRLPGTIGGASVMNARAYGSEISAIITGARVVTLAGVLEERSLRAEQFAYKQSPFSADGVIVAEVTFELGPGDSARSRARMDEIAARRAANHEWDFPSCGCVFQNDRRVGESSGKLIDRLGLKGQRLGEAQVSPYHANFIINLGGARAIDVLTLARHVQSEVAARTGHQLPFEMQLLGEFPKRLR